MKIFRTRDEFRRWRSGLPAHARIGLVPTMGALHEGHASLVRMSRERCDFTVATIFVNPMQFGANEDLARYPRPFEADAKLLEDLGTDALIAPDPSEVYLADASTAVVEDSVSQPLCGAFRPGHFRGVTTVVLKLLNWVQPTHAFFGQKDAQQCLVIERMVRDLDVPVEIIRGPTVREPDGLALSSRNRYLSAEDRERAPLIYRALLTVQKAFATGERDAQMLERLGRDVLAEEPAFKTQYFEVRHSRSLAPIETVDADGALVAVAAFLGSTRLIDNLELKI